MVQLESIALVERSLGIEMGTIKDLYRHSLVLLTDLYQLTMAYGYWKAGFADRESVFHLFFRRHPFQGGYAIAAGLEPAIEVLRDFQFREDDIDYLRDLQGNDGQQLFDATFLEELSTLRFCCDVDAMPEGTVVHPHEPLMRVQGPILQCQLLETVLLNIVNFQTLIATRAARISSAAAPDPVLEFGLRRAQGIDGGLAASRAAYLGGCAATSNVLAGKLFDIPVKGTHAHSWVMSFDDELTSFEQYANAMPNNCVFLVDTYSTLRGVENAIAVGRQLRQQGHEMVGIRLDSGDLAELSKQARQMLDDAGFPQAVIVASNDLDEQLIENLKNQGAAIGVWGVGTKLATAFDQPALGGVYKLSAIKADDGSWTPKVKLSEQPIKVSNPGILQVRRFVRDNQCVVDVIYDQLFGCNSDTAVDVSDPFRDIPLPADAEQADLLVPIFRDGKCVYPVPTLAAAREHAMQQVQQLHPSVRRFVNPHRYDVGLEYSLSESKRRLVESARSSAR